MQTIAEALSIAEKALGKEQRLDTELLLCKLLKKSRSYLFAFAETALSDSDYDIFCEQLQQLKSGRPVAYILGEREFWSMAFKVNEHTLIPRPDTETLVEFMLQRFGSREQLTVLDAGTGSGVLAISLKKEQTNWQVFASDYSFEALKVATFNSENLQAAVSVFQGDWLQALANNSLDVIVSNPPYIAEQDPHLSALHYEPITALVAKQQGFADIQQLIAQSLRVLKPSGELWLEHGFEQAQECRELLNLAGFTDVQSVQDLSGNWRISGGICHG